MYLVDIDTHQLHEFIGSQIPPYAIISHRWGSQELTFKEVSKQRIDQTKQGYQKLLGACQTSAQYGLRYLWIDTFCIDKRSSAELSEAINSMFTWYKNAQVCLAYLDDIPPGEKNSQVAFRGSLWFTRCWTLQELLAPNRVDFFDSAWNCIGNKTSKCGRVEEATGIPIRILAATDDSWIRHTSIAEKMSWAANRHATRVEDIAYSLLGIFRVNIPLLYGEGEAAFVRLQEEIVRSSTDSSFLHWALSRPTQTLFATSPADFRGPNSEVPAFGEAFSLNNMGLVIETQLTRYMVNVYGLGIARPCKQSLVESPIMLIQKCVDGDYYHKLAIVDPIHLTYSNWTRKRRLTVLRDAIKCSCRLVIPSESLRQIEHQTLEAFTSVVAIPGPSVILEKTRSTFFDIPGETGYGADMSTSLLECGFSWERVQMLRTNWRPNWSFYGFWIDFCFDFDSYPCVLLRRQLRDEDSNYKAKGITVQQLAGEHPGEQWDWSAPYMLRVEDQHTNAPSFFHRFGKGVSDDMFSNSRCLPVEFNNSNRGFCLKIEAPFTDSNKLGSWVLTVFGV